MISITPQAQSEVSQPPIAHDFAAYLAKRYGFSRVFQVNCRRGDDENVGMAVYAGDSASNIPWRGNHGVSSEWISHDFEYGPMQSIDRSKVRESIVLCTGGIEQLADPPYLLETLRSLLEDAPVAILTASGCDARDSTRVYREEARIKPATAPPGRTETGDYTLPGVRSLLENAGLEVLFNGWTCSDVAGLRRSSPLSVVRQPRRVVAPLEFRVVALVGAYNEEDIIESFLHHMIQQGIEVLLLDNWSTDRTAERAAPFLNRGLIGIEKFPAGGPTTTHEWYKMLRRKEELSSEIQANWFIHLDPDEMRESPWPHITLREALYRVETEGFNAVDHTCIVFHPTEGRSEYSNEIPILDQLPYFEFGHRPGHFSQVKAWKRQVVPVHCADTGGHQVCFPGRRVYPFKFLLRHYPIRSQVHGMRKVFTERRPRINPLLRQRGWHTHYDEYSPDSFLRDVSTLRRFEPHKFYEEFLVERLSGIGVEPVSVDAAGH